MVSNVIVRMFSDEKTLAEAVADRICTLVSSRWKKGKETVIALASGSSTKAVYKELIRRHKKEGFSFEHCHSFLLDEYYPIPPESPMSLSHQMNGVLSKLDIPEFNRNELNGELSEIEIESHCQEYEMQIAAMAGIDFLLLGIGRNGHIAFNEPGSPRESRTRLVELSDLTRQDATRIFGSSSIVPSRALTMGIGTLLEAKEISLVAVGMHKAPIIKSLVNGVISEFVPASYLKKHQAFTLFVDEAAGFYLNREPTAEAH